MTENEKCMEVQSTTATHLQMYLITGGVEFFGINLVRYLMQRGIQGAFSVLVAKRLLRKPKKLGRIAKKHAQNIAVLLITVLMFARSN